MWEQRVVVLLVGLFVVPQLVAAGGIVPTNGMVIRRSVRFVRGTYDVPSGIVAGADNIVINLVGIIRLPLLQVHKYHAHPPAFS